MDWSGDRRTRSNQVCPGTEEAHGYLAGTHIRDKDAAVAALLLAEFAAELKQQGKTLWQELQSIYQRIGCFQERSFAVTLPGADGMERMQRVIAAFRTNPPTKLGDCTITQVRDYATQKIHSLQTPGLVKTLDGRKPS